MPRSTSAAPGVAIMTLDRRTFKAAELMTQHPPRWYNDNKLVVAAVSCPPGAEHRGTVGYSRWAAMDLPPRIEPLAPDLVVTQPGFFDYRPVLEGAEEWHVNFADPHLFVAYAGSLLAQDELQVAEHPVLGALREALVAGGYDPRTVSNEGPTPVLVTGVERRVAIATDPDPAAGRPWGLYGNRFSRADADLVRRALTRQDPPTDTNLIAMAALPGGSGAYAEGEIRTILVTAFTGFSAAVQELADLAPDSPVVVHSGFWGCGAFGGNLGADVGPPDHRRRHGRAGSPGAPHGRPRGRWPRREGRGAHRGADRHKWPRDGSLPCGARGAAFPVGGQRWQLG